MRIGIFVGSFNPPHLTHFNIVEYLINNDYLDKVLFIPVNKSKKELIDINHRYRMLKLYTEKNNKTDVLDIEKENNDSFSYERYLIIKNLYPQDDLHIIMGADNYIETTNWEHYKEIINYGNLIIINRNNHIIQNAQKNITIIPSIGNHSSTAFRENKQKRKYFTIDEITLYIRENSLYEDIK